MDQTFEIFDAEQIQDQTQSVSTEHFSVAKRYSMLLSPLKIYIAKIYETSPQLIIFEQYFSFNSFEIFDGVTTFLGILNLFTEDFLPWKQDQRGSLVVQRSLRVWEAADQFPADFQYHFKLAVQAPLLNFRQIKRVVPCKTRLTRCQNNRAAYYPTEPAV